MSEEEQGFIVRDKRGRTEPDSSPTPAADSPKSDPIPPPTEGATSDSGPQEPGPPVTFSSFVFSLGTSALMLMGESLDPQQPSIPVNLPQAKEIVDILSMLEEKTKGNLSSDESSVIRDMLYTLRMKYVGLTSSTPQPPTS